VAKLGGRLTEQAAEIKHQTKIECCWKADEKRTTQLHEQQGALAELYEYHYSCHRDYPDMMHQVAQLAHCVGKGDHAVLASLLGLRAELMSSWRPRSSMGSSSSHHRSCFVGTSRSHRSASCRSAD
jgi:hypothetical protein